MILPDVNVLVHAHREDMDEHGDYAAWLTSVAQGDESFALSAATVAGFIRVVTHPRVFTKPTAGDVAVAFVEALAESPQSRWLEAAERWWPTFSDFCRRSGARGNIVPDASLAALALEHGCRLATADHGFARFPGLRWFHPLDRSS